MFSSACKLLNMDAYSNDFQKVFLVKSPCHCNQILASKLVKMNAYSNDLQKSFLGKKSCDCNQIRSNQVVASVNALNHFHF